MCYSGFIYIKRDEDWGQYARQSPLNAHSHTSGPVWAAATRPAGENEQKCQFKAKQCVKKPQKLKL